MNTDQRFDEVNARLERIEDKVDRLLEFFTPPEESPQETDLLAAPLTK